MHKAFWGTGIVRLTLLAHLLTQLFLYKAWTLHRVFPTLTVFSFASTIPKEIPFSIHSATLILTVVLLWKINWKKGIGWWMALVVLTWCLDYVFWQPYTYFFLAVAGIHFFSMSRELFFTRCLLLLSALYTFSGLHKINGAFLYTIWDAYFLKKLVGITSTDSSFLIFHYAGLLVGLIEILFGVGLLFQRTRFWAFRGLVAMHGLILLGLSPIGLFSNGAVVPWNLALFGISVMGCVALKKKFFDAPWPLEFKKQGLVIFFFWILPVWGYFGYYNQYFSFNVYSGKGKSLYIFFDQYNDCPKPLRPYLYPKKMDNQKYWVVSPKRWCKGELHLLLPNDDYILNSFAMAYENQFPNSKGYWYVTSYPFKADTSHKIKMGNSLQVGCIENLQKKR